MSHYEQAVAICELVIASGGEAGLMSFDDYTMVLATVGGMRHEVKVG